MSGPPSCLFQFYMQNLYLKLQLLLKLNLAFIKCHYLFISRSLLNLKLQVKFKWVGISQFECLNEC